MALLPQEPKQQKALVVILAVLAGLYLFWEYWYTPNAEELTALDTRVVDLEDRNRQAQILAARGGSDLEERNALYRRHVMALEELIPATEEVAVLVRTIADEARFAGVELRDLNPEADVPGEVYTRKSWGLGVYGEYDDVGRFLTSIASLPRIITPLDVELLPGTQDLGPGSMLEDPVQATFRIELYVLPDPSAPRPPEADSAQVGG